MTNKNHLTWVFPCILGSNADRQRYHKNLTNVLIIRVYLSRLYTKSTRCISWL
jgi:hypothetical protein